MKHRFSLILILLFLFVGNMGLAQDNDIVFSDEIVFLSFSDDALVNIQASSDGAYLLGLEQQYLIEAETDGQAIRLIPQENKLLVWDTSSIADSAGLPLEAVNQIPVEIVENALNESFAVSPVENWVAVQNPSSIEIIEIPNLNSIASLDINTIGRMAWSRDEGLIAQFSEGMLHVWEIDTGVMFTYPLAGHERATVYGIPDGWLIDNYAGDSDISFSVCSLHLTDCVSYQSADSSMYPILYTANSSLLMISHQAERKVLVWERGENLNYTFIELSNTSGASFCPIQLSSNGLYALSNCSIEGLEGRPIWNLTTLNPISALVQQRSMIWFREDTYYLTLYSIDLPVLELSIYNARNSSLLDSIVLPDDSIPLWETVVENNANLAYFHTGASLLPISNELVLINLGWAAFIVSITESTG